MPLIFLKLGGSLITDKRKPQTPRLKVITRLAQETAAACAANPDLRLVIGHGSGSFGHVAAKRYNTRAGVKTRDDWRGFAEVSRVAAQLNRLVADAFGAAGVPVWSLSPSASALCENGELRELEQRPIRTALEHNLVPLVHGDVALDSVRGGTIVSTEDVFYWLAQHLKPNWILLAGMVNGVYERDPLADTNAQPISTLTANNLTSILGGLTGSHATDVTGGMASKVQAMAALVNTLPGLRVRFFSGEPASALQRVLLEPEIAVGTRLE